MCHKGQVPAGQDFDRTDITPEILEAVKPVYPYLRHAMLFGDGEPMVYRDFWNVVQDIREASPKCCIDFINNGTMMHAKNIENCFKYNISCMGLSLGGATSESHNHIRKDSDLNEIIDNFKLMRDLKKEKNRYEPYVNTLIVVMKSNYRELPDFVELCAELDFHSIELQQMFVTHPMVECEVVTHIEAEPFIREAGQLARRKDIGFRHYPLESGKNYGHYKKSGFNHNDVMFLPKYDKIQDGGYCAAQQPWNTVYVLHDGKVVPDCHWWSSIRETQYNVCGQLSKSNNILDVWNGIVYQGIRDRVKRGKILSQCRGCGLAGGVIARYRSTKTDHTDPSQEKKYLSVNYKSVKQIPCWDIVTYSYNNKEWIDPFLLSLSQTLIDKNKLITIYDDSDVTPEIADSYGLNVQIVPINRHPGKLQNLSISEALSMRIATIQEQKTNFVCMVDIDVVFLLKGWDSLFNIKLNQGFNLIASSIRYLQVAETTIMLTDKALFEDARFEHTNGIEGFDNSVIKIPSTIVEHVAVTYFNLKRGGKNYFITKSAPREERSRWGHLALTDEGEEFFYHNLYAGRSKTGCIMSAEEIYKAAATLFFAEENPILLRKYLTAKGITFRQFIQEHDQIIDLTQEQAIHLSQYPANEMIKHLRSYIISQNNSRTK